MESLFLMKSEKNTRDKMNYSFLPEARIEFFSAIEYYENCSTGLGLRDAA